ncbi:MAG TPA: VOC family protein [Rubrobacteraceae bacterium]|nr:VOC family protein [Rubrobacteraceae bacterium]
MISGNDHLVILVEALEAAVAGYEELGFRVSPGGEHADGLTRNALVPFADGTYLLELVSFVDPADTRDNAWGWRPFFEKGGDLIDHCAASDGLAADACRLVAAGFEVSGPEEGGRRLPDETEMRWRIARVRQEGRVMPFLIEDLTPRSLRVPGGKATEHPNGARGIIRLLLAVEDADNARASLAALAAVEKPVGGPVDTLRVGSHELTLVASGGNAERRLETLGPGPLAAELAATRDEDLSPDLAQGARIQMRRR